MKYFKFDYWFDDKNLYWEVISEVELAKRMAFLREFQETVNVDEEVETWIEIRDLLEGNCDLCWEDTYVDYADFLTMYSKPPVIKDITEEEYKAVKRIVGTNIFGGSFFYAYIDYLDSIIENIEVAIANGEMTNDFFTDLGRAHQLVANVKEQIKVVEDFGI